jgi:saccharopine dehydrogenase-like NADP-dependent oxidoreductase
MKCSRTWHALHHPIEFQGQQIVPIQFHNALLAGSRVAGPAYQGKTNIGCFSPA